MMVETIKLGCEENEPDEPLLPESSIPQTTPCGLPIADLEDTAENDEEDWQTY